MLSKNFMGQLSHILNVSSKFAPVTDVDDRKMKKNFSKNAPD